MTSLHQLPILIIGYGNSLRGEDALGRLVVENISQQGLPTVVTMSIAQLVPEVAAMIAESRAVIFVDACLAEQANTIVAHKITDASCFHGASHEAAPREVLALAALCYGKLPPAWLIAVPATDFNFTDEISAAAQARVFAATRTVEQLVAQLHGDEVANA